MPFKFNALTGNLDLVNENTLGSLTPTKGNLAVGNGTAWTALGVGDNDDVLTADSAEAEGIKWAAGSGSVTGEEGSPIILDSSGNQVAFSSKKYYILEDDFYYESGNGSKVWPWYSLTNGSGASAETSEASLAATEFGVFQLQTGTTTGGEAGLQKTNLSYDVIGNAYLTLEWRVQFPTLADVTDDYFLRLGFHNGFVFTSTISEGIYFEYDRSNSTNWRGVCTSSSTSTRTSGTDVAVGTSYQNIKLTINAAGTSVNFAVDGTSIGDITTNIPTYLQELAALMKKEAGTTSRSSNIDWVKMYIEYTSDRW